MNVSCLAFNAAHARCGRLIIIAGIEVIEPALVGELTEIALGSDRIRHSLARKGQDSSASDEFHADWGAR
jgi:hypothetical protein